MQFLEKLRHNMTTSVHGKNEALKWTWNGGGSGTGTGDGKSDLGSLPFAMEIKIKQWQPQPIVCCDSDRRTNTHTAIACKQSSKEVILAAAFNSEYFQPDYKFLAFPLSCVSHWFLVSLAFFFSWLHFGCSFVFVSTQFSKTKLRSASSTGLSNHRCITYRSLLLLPESRGSVKDRCKT